MARVRIAAVIGSAVTAAFLAWAEPGEAQDLMALAGACDNGNMAACNRLLPIARSHCLNGDNRSCQIAAQLAQMGASAPNQGYPTNHYDPLAPHRDTLQGTNDYIRSYCSDPNMAAQLRAFN
jgi:hypothetical protein